MAIRDTAKLIELMQGFSALKVISAVKKECGLKSARVIYEAL